MREAAGYVTLDTNEGAKQVEEGVAAARPAIFGGSPGDPRSGKLLFRVSWQTRCTARILYVSRACLSRDFPILLDIPKFSIFPGRVYRISCAYLHRLDSRRALAVRIFNFPVASCVHEIFLKFFPAPLAEGRNM